MNDNTKAEEAARWIRAMLTHAALANANTADPQTAKTQLLCVIRMAGNAYGALCEERPDPKTTFVGETVLVPGRIGDELEGLAITLGNGGVLP